MYGKTDLGETYADALVDLYGQAAARKQLIELSQAKGAPELDRTASQAVLTLAAELDSKNRANLEHFANHTEILPRQFAHDAGDCLYGYSERMYYVGQELALTPGSQLPLPKAGEVSVRQFPFAASSKGTPTWVDCFVVPKGRLAKNGDLIIAFLQFIETDAAYMIFAQPIAYGAATYLLPATRAPYEDKDVLAVEPLLPSFLKELDSSFVVDNHAVWRGMQVAGKQLRDSLLKH
jgi:hypothetical protein